MVDPLPLRISPLLKQKGRELQLDYAPAPWMLKQCVETGIVFLANPPAYEALSETYAYEVTFRKESAARKRAEPLRYAFSALLKHFRAKILKRNKVLAILRKLIAASGSAHIRVLDVGCGWGELMETLVASLPAQQRARVTPHGVDISRHLARLSDEKFTPLGGRCVHASASDGVQRFAEGYFDIIVMASYLEHEASPLAVLANCRKRLKPGGSIVVKVPNFACFNRILRGPRWSGFRWPDHVNYFTPETLRALAVQAGLDVVRMSALDSTPFSDNMYALMRPRAVCVETAVDMARDAPARMAADMAVDMAVDMAADTAARMAADLAADTVAPGSRQGPGDSGNHSATMAGCASPHSSLSNSSPPACSPVPRWPPAAPSITGATTAARTPLSASCSPTSPPATPAAST